MDSSYQDGASEALVERVDIEQIRAPLQLRNGVVVPNRLVKVAMVEGIGMGGGLPDYRHRQLYKRWGEGGWGMIITGNCQVDPRYLATGQDRTFGDHSDRTVRAYSAWRTSTLANLPRGYEPPVLLVQLSHGGLQSSGTVNASRWPWQPAVAPTSARPDTASNAGGIIGFLGWLWARIMWPVPSRQIVDFDEWEDIVQMFVQAAITVEKAGYDGVQVHSAHGYLLAEYLSPLTNPDVRPLPNVPAIIPLRLHLLWKILQGIRANVKDGFVVAVKINCSDFVQGGLDEEESAMLIKEIVSWQLMEILEISGGNYSSPAFATFDSPRETLFAKFTRSLIPQLPPSPKGPVILLTGGLHSRALIADAISSRACDLAGIGRPACIVPSMPRSIIFNSDIPDDEAKVGGYKIRGADTMKWLLGGGSPASGIAGGGKGQIAPASYAEIEVGKPSSATGTTYTNTADEQTPLLASDSDGQTASADSGDAKRPRGIPLIGAGVSTFWHGWQLSRMGRGRDPDPQMDWLFGGVLWEMVIWGIMGAVKGIQTT